MATNTWLDQCRKQKREVGALEENMEPVQEFSDSLHLEEMLISLESTLTPKQTAAFLLLDIFKFSADEVAGIVRSTPGGVYASVQRARKRIASIDETTVERKRENMNSNSIIEAYLAAFNSGDLNGILQLFSDQAQNEAFFGFQEYLKEEMLKGSLKFGTLRRWSIELEKQGYAFERNEKEQRIYYKRDIVALRQLQKMISEKVSMVNACTKIASKYINNKELEQTLDVHQQKNVQIAVSKEELQSMIEQAIEKEREVMFKAFEAKMNDVVEKRDRILTQQLNRSLEERRLEIAAAQEEKETKKPWWSKLFSK